MAKRDGPEPERSGFRRKCEYFGMGLGTECKYTCARNLCASHNGRRKGLGTKTSCGTRTRLQSKTAFCGSQPRHHGELPRRRLCSRGSEVQFRKLADIKHYIAA